MKLSGSERRYNTLRSHRRIISHVDASLYQYMVITAGSLAPGVKQRLATPASTHLATVTTDLQRSN